MSNVTGTILGASVGPAETAPSNGGTGIALLSLITFRRCSTFPARQNIEVTTGFLNTVNDATPGASVASITGSQRYAGMLGGIIVLGPDQVLSTPAGTLYGGIYMYVGYAGTNTAAAAVGQPAFWVAPTSSVPEDYFQVSSDAKTSTTVPTFVAGVFLSAPTAGNYCFIQIAGRATVQYQTTVTSTAVGAMVYVPASANPASTFDAIV